MAKKLTVTRSRRTEKVNQRRNHQMMPTKRSLKSKVKRFRRRRTRRKREGGGEGGEKEKEAKVLDAPECDEGVDDVGEPTTKLAAHSTH